MLRRFFISLALFVCALHAVSGAAAAQEKKATWKGGPLHVVTALKGGGFLTGARAIENYYGQAGYYVSFRIGVLAEHKALGVQHGWAIPGTVALNLEGGFSRITGRDQTAAPYPDLTLLHIPITLGVEYAFRFSEEQLLVPYVGGGGAAAYFREAVGLVPEDVVDGARFGWFGEAGLRLHIDRYDRAAERAFTESVGIRNTYLDVRARYHGINGLDSGIDLSGLVFDGGFTFEF